MGRKVFTCLKSILLPEFTRRHTFVLRRKPIIHSTTRIEHLLYAGPVLVQAAQERTNMAPKVTGRLPALWWKVDNTMFKGKKKKPCFQL